MTNKEEIIKSIKCKWVHENELYIASDATLWPCCFLWSEQAEYPERTKEKILKIGPENWNNLRFHKKEDILKNAWYQEELEKSWSPEHPLHFNRCITNCGFDRALDNEMVDLTNVIK